MKKLADLVSFESGIPPFRILESAVPTDPIYTYFGQSHIDGDLVGLNVDEEPKVIRTADTVSTVKTGDIIFSLISGKAAIVSAAHEGYLFTQNFVRVTIQKKLNSEYVVYLLNEEPDIQRQLKRELQGSVVMKYSMKQLRELTITSLPDIEKQAIIGSIYIKQMRVEALEKRVAENKRLYVLGLLKGVRGDDEGTRV